MTYRADQPGTPRAASSERPRPDKSNSPAGTFRRGVFSVGGGSLVSVVALFVEAVIVARTLSVESMGVYVFFQASLGLLTIAVDLGFRTTAAQFLAAETDGVRQSQLTSSLLTFRLLLVAAVSPLILLAAWLLPGWLNMPGLGGLLLAMPVVLALASLDELQTGLLQGLQRYRSIALAQIVRSLLRLGLSALVLVVLGWGLHALLLSWIVSYGASAALQHLALPVRQRLQLRWSVLREALRFGLPLQLTRYLWFAMQRIDTFVLSALVGPAGVAFYDVATRVPQGLQRLFEAYYAVYHPSLSSRLARHDTAGAEGLMSRSLRLFSVTTLFLAWGAVLFGRELITLLFGERYGESGPALAVVLLAFSLASAINLQGYALTASGRPSRSFAVNLLRSSVSFGGDFLLIPLFGFIGAAYATLAAQVAAAPLAWWYLRRARLPSHGRVQARHFVLAAGVFAAFLWLPPLGLGLRLALLAGFPVLALALALVSVDDLAMVLPERLVGRARVSTPLAGQPGGGEG